MAVEKSDLTQYIQRLQALKADIPAIMGGIAVGEGAYAVRQARMICKADGIVNTGQYRRNWQSDKTAKRSGRRYIVRFYNPLDYAGHLEHGFRGHFVPGHWEGKVFVYNPGDPKGGMYVPKGGGKYFRGKFVMKRAVRRTKDTQQARVTRKINQAIKRCMEGKE